MRWLVVTLVAAAGIAVGLAFGAKWVLGPLLGYAVYRAGTSMLRGLARDARAPDGDPEPVLDRPQRTLYWCESCGAELMLVVKGTEIPPRHCGERMYERVELLREPDTPVGGGRS